MLRWTFWWRNQYTAHHAGFMGVQNFYDDHGNHTSRSYWFGPIAFGWYTCG